MIPTRAFIHSCIICITLLSVYPYNAYSDNGIEAVTKPSKDVTLSFVQPGQIVKIHVKEGDLVKAGHLLVQLDDSVEQAQLAQLKAQSEDTTRIEAGQASLDQKRVDLEKFQGAAELGAVTKLELEYKKLDVTIAGLSLKIAQFEHEQDLRKYAEARIRIDKMQFKSPIAGRIEEIYVEEGESVNSLADVVRVVEIDPLWIDVPVLLAQAKTLSYGHDAIVSFPDSGQTSTKGKIIFIGTVADVGSGTLKTRIEIANGSKRPGGEHVTVIFSQPDDKTKEK